MPSSAPKTTIPAITRVRSMVMRAKVVLLGPTATPRRCFRPSLLWEGATRYAQGTPEPRAGEPRLHAAQEETATRSSQSAHPVGARRWNSRGPEWFEAWTGYHPNSSRQLALAFRCRIAWPAEPLAIQRLKGEADKREVCPVYGTITRKVVAPARCCSRRLACITQDELATPQRLVTVTGSATEACSRKIAQQAAFTGRSI